MVSAVGNPCKQCQTRVLNFGQHVEERCPGRPDGGVHMLTVPPDIDDLYMVHGNPPYDPPNPLLKYRMQNPTPSETTEERTPMESQRDSIAGLLVAAMVPALVGMLLVGLVFGDWWHQTVPTRRRRPLHRVKTWMRGDRVRITTGKCAGQTGTVESNVFQRTADYPNDLSDGFQVMLDTGDLVTMRWDQVVSCPH